MERGGRKKREESRTMERSNIYITKRQRKRERGRTRRIVKGTNIKNPGIKKHKLPL